MKTAKLNPIQRLETIHQAAYDSYCKALNEFVAARKRMEGCKLNAKRAMEVLEFAKKEKAQESINVKFTLFHDKDWEEWQVRVWINNKLDEAKTYHTDDKEDAQDTMICMKKELRDHPERYR